MNKPLRFTGRIRSFQCAFKGIWIMIQSQHNAWIHALATALVVGAGFFFRIAAHEWNWIILAVMAVWTAEALNTAFEFLADATNLTFHPLIGKAKDVAAGAVLLAAIGSAAIGLLVFLPHVMSLIGR
jgi:diacylglycerol kinase